MAELNILTENDHVVVKFQDQQILDETYARKLGMRLLQVVDDADEKHIVLNFDKVTFMASCMIGQLIQVRNKCKKLGVKLKICCLSANLSEAICLMNVDKILDIFECETSAKAT